MERKQIKEKTRARDASRALVVVKSKNGREKKRKQGPRRVSGLVEMKKR
jgi:hypothetical protein